MQTFANNHHHKTTTTTTTTQIFYNSTNIIPNIDDELSKIIKETHSETIFIFIFSLMSIPSNIFLIIFYANKIFLYKRYNKIFAPNKLKHVYAANCFNTYLVEICLFDTIISIHLLVDTIFKHLYDYNLTIYESIFDISQFTCKFFIHALHISSAMTSWLTVLLSFNRFMLLFRFRSNRLCINTKYLTLFLFCICTVANVFRLELLYFNSDNIQTNQQQQQQQHFIYQYLNLTTSDLTITNPQCGFNLQSIVYTLSDTTNTVFWSLIFYNIIFSLVPACGNLILSVYLIYRHSKLKKQIILNHFKKLKHLNQIRNSTISLNNINKQQQQKNTNNNNNNNEQNIIEILINNGNNLNDAANLNIEKYIADFFHTCIPCITISCTYVICYLPNTILETTNQLIPMIFLLKIRIYFTYLRYLFHGCKFYLLFLVSYKFRKEFLKFLFVKILKRKNYGHKKQQQQQQQQRQRGNQQDGYWSKNGKCSKNNNNNMKNVFYRNTTSSNNSRLSNTLIEARITYL